MSTIVIHSGKRVKHKQMSQNVLRWMLSIVIEGLKKNLTVQSHAAGLQQNAQI